MNIGDIKKMHNRHGDDFTVKIIDLFEYEGIEYAEVEPVGFNGFPREVSLAILKEVDNE